MVQYLQQFGAAVKIARKERHLSQQALADRLSMSKRTIVNIEQGKTNAKAETLFMVAIELKISMDAILLPGQQDVDPKVADFFRGKKPKAVHQYLTVCSAIEGIGKEM